MNRTWASRWQLTGGSIISRRSTSANPESPPTFRSASSRQQNLGKRCSHFLIRRSRSQKPPSLDLECLQVHQTPNPLRISQRCTECQDVLSFPAVARGTGCVFTFFRGRTSSSWVYERSLWSTCLQPRRAGWPHTHQLNPPLLFFSIFLPWISRAKKRRKKTY